MIDVSSLGAWNGHLFAMPWSRKGPPHCWTASANLGTETAVRIPAHQVPYLLFLLKVKLKLGCSPIYCYSFIGKKGWWIQHVSSRFGSARTGRSMAGFNINHISTMRLVGRCNPTWNQSHYLYLCKLILIISVCIYLYLYCIYLNSICIFLVVEPPRVFFKCVSDLGSSW